MQRMVLVAVIAALVGCSSSLSLDETGYVEPSDDPMVLVPEDQLNSAQYDGAVLEIVSPSSGSFLPYDEASRFEARLRAADGSLLDFDELVWTSNIDDSWVRQGLSFDDATLDVGLHDITAEVLLPNGDRLVYTVGGLLVQSRFAGTYAGMFSADVDYQGAILTCTGSALLVVDPYGEKVVGDGDCLASLQGNDLPLVFLFDLDNDWGHITGLAAADIGGFFQYDFPAEGSLNPVRGGFDIGFGGDVFGFVGVDARLGAERVSRDTN